MKIDDKKVRRDSIELVNDSGQPSVIHAEFMDGTALTEVQMDDLEIEYKSLIQRMGIERNIDELPEYDFDMYCNEPEKLRELEQRSKLKDILN